MDLAELTFDRTLCEADDRRDAWTDATGSSAPATRPAGPFVLREDRNERPVAGYAHVLVRTAVLLTTAIASLVLIFSSGVEADSSPRTMVSHVVQPGDTLWNLASRYTPAGGDVRATVAVIRQANSLESSDVEVGSLLQIPAG